MEGLGRSGSGSQYGARRTAIDTSMNIQELDRSVRHEANGGDQLNAKCSGDGWGSSAMRTGSKGCIVLSYKRTRRQKPLVTTGHVRL